MEATPSDLVAKTLNVQNHLWCSEGFLRAADHALSSFCHCHNEVPRIIQQEPCFGRRDMEGYGTDVIS